MIGLDSNVLVRLITRDHAEQTRAAQKIVAEADDASLHVNLVVLAELAWVLRRAYRYQNAVVLDAIEGVLRGREFVVERHAIASDALDNARRAKCGYADALIDRLNADAGVRSTLTFDIKAKRLPAMSDAAAYK